MPTLELKNCLVVVLRTEESRPLVIEAFDSGLDRARSVHWITSQPELLELVVRAYRLEGRLDELETLDDLNVTAGGDPGGDEDWLATLRNLDPSERRRMLRGGDEAA